LHTFERWIEAKGSRGIPRKLKVHDKQQDFLEIDKPQGTEAVQQLNRQQFG
jgi:hypothetical protein